MGLGEEGGSCGGGGAGLGRSDQVLFFFIFSYLRLYILCYTYFTFYTFLILGQTNLIFRSTDPTDPVSREMKIK